MGIDQEILDKEESEKIKDDPEEIDNNEESEKIKDDPEEIEDIEEALVPNLGGAGETKEKIVDMQSGAKIRAEWRDLKEICPKIFSGPELFLGYVAPPDIIKLNPESIAEGFKIENDNEITKFIKSDASSVGKLFQLTVAYRYKDVYQHVPKQGKKYDIQITHQDLLGEKVEVRCINRNTESNILFTPSSRKKQNFNGLKEKLKEISFYEFVDITEFPICKIYFLFKDVVIMWLLIDDDNWIRKDGWASKLEFSNLLEKTLNNYIIRRLDKNNNYYFSFLSMEEGIELMTSYQEN